MEEKMELRLIEPQENGFLQHIKWNSEEMREWVAAKVEEYTGLVYTEETMATAKNDRATLNKMIKEIEDVRKQVKKKCLEPYNEFEKEVKEVTALIQKPVGMIDEQIKEYENMQRAEKQEKIEAAYKDAIGELSDVLKFEQFFRPEYLNKSYPLRKAIAEMEQKIQKVTSNLETINNLESKFRINVRDVYLRTLDFSKAMAEDRRLKELEEKTEAERLAREEAERKRQEAERIAKEEAEKRRVEEERRRAEEEAKREAEARAEQASAVEKAAEAIERKASEKEKIQEAPVKRYKTRFCAVGTKEQLQSLIRFMQENNIEYGRI